MKQIKILLACFTCAACFANAFAQGCIVTFMGQDRAKQYHIPLSTVTVSNLTQGWEEVLYYPDTVLRLGVDGIENHQERQEIQLRQNVPNPFDGTTEFALSLPEDRDVLLEIYDATGQLAVGEHFTALVAGTHMFQVVLSSPQIYLLSARIDDGQMTIKIVNQGRGTANAIRHLGMTDKNGDYTIYLKTDKSPKSHPFNLGDEMQYVGSIMVDGTPLESETISHSQMGDENVRLIFDVTVPTVITADVVDIQGSTATCGGNVIDDGDATVISRGVCWGISPNPTTSDNHTSDGSGMGNFTSSISELIPNTTYYVRAYAINSVGTAYGEEKMFTAVPSACPNVATVTDIDGNVYNTVQIGNQCWMKENLRTTKYADGTSITLGDSASNTIPYRYYPNFDASNVPVYGYLYNWPAVMKCAVPGDTNSGDVQGVCPAGWHVPSEAEWMELTDFVSSQNTFVCGDTNINIAKALAATTGWRNCTGTCEVGNNISANNTTGFSVLPAGYYSNYTSSGEAGFGTDANFWSATRNQSGGYAYNLELYYNHAFVNWCGYYYQLSCSVRCLLGGGEMVTPPTVTTHNVTNVTAFTATCGGNVVSEGDTSVIARGVCWSTTQYPTIFDDHTSDGCGMGNFTSVITGLMPNTTYYIRAYASSGVGMAYGEMMTFTTFCNTVAVTITGDTNINYGQSITLFANGADHYHWNTNDTMENITIYPTANTTYTVIGTNNYGCADTATFTVTVNYFAPIVTTNDISNITVNTATCGGNVIFEGAPTTACGVCWSTVQNPSIADNYTSDGSNMGGFNSFICSLTPNTTYYVRAYVTNVVGVAYGEERTFTTTAIPTGDAIPCSSTPTVTDYDGNVYNTVQIGSQCWMKENMRTTKYADGTSIALNPGYDMTNTIAYRYCPNDDTSTVITYGYLYNWKAVMRDFSSSNSIPSGVQGICPMGWHVPSNAEWTQLTDYVKSHSEYLCDGDSNNYAKALASSVGWTSNNILCRVGNRPCANNATGFSILPAGSYMDVITGSCNYGVGADFWSATQRNNNIAYIYDLSYNSSSMFEDYNQKVRGFSVRCLRD